MKRVAIIADSHWDEHSRFEECERVHGWIADDIAARAPDLIIHTGDVTERKSTPRERMAVARWIRRVTDVAPLIIVRGNHDPLGDLPLYAKLETRHPVYVVEQAEVLEVAGFMVGCLGWPSKASVLALGAESHVEGELIAGDALRNVLRGLGQQMSRATVAEPRILAAHAMVRGSVTSTGQPLVGCDLEVGLEDIALTDADFVALGHIHKGQDWEDVFNRPMCPVVYPGSPRRTAFGETETKGYVIAEFEGSACVGWMRVETPCAPMFLLEDEWGLDEETGKNAWLAGLHGYPGREHLAGAEVRFRYHVPGDLREEARAAAESIKARLLAEGAVDVKVDPQVIPTGAARAPEVARAKTLADKLLALWKARCTTPPEPRLQRLTDKVSQLEHEVARAV
jgi:exonuclease SbcD